MHSPAQALWALTLALLVPACGGSSSETPPPLEPDPASYLYTGPRLPAVTDLPEATLAPDTALDDAEPAAPSKPAPATWGAGKVPTSSEGAGKR
jgi:hypothetical protein